MCLHAPHWPVPPNPLGSGLFPQNSLESCPRQLINILPLVKFSWPCLIVFSLGFSSVQACQQFVSLKLFLLGCYHFRALFPPSRLCFSSLHMYTLPILSPFPRDSSFIDTIEFQRKKLQLHFVGFILEMTSSLTSTWKIHNHSFNWGFLSPKDCYGEGLSQSL